MAKSYQRSRKLKKMNQQENEQPESFESAFKRLESILERMNSNTVSLDESLHLFEEADKLINTCNKRLNDAEKKIEMLIKTRNGDLVLGPDLKPMTQG